MLLLLRRLGLCLQHFGHNLLFFNQEGSDNPSLDTVSTSRSSISPRDSFLSLRQGLQFLGSGLDNPSQLLFAVTALGYCSNLLLVKEDQLGSRGLGTVS